MSVPSKPITSPKYKEGGLAPYGHHTVKIIAFRPTERGAPYYKVDLKGVRFTVPENQLK